MKYYLDALKQYFNFKGRCSRKAFWMFVLINILFLWTAVILDNLLSLTGSETYLFTDIKYGAFHNFYSAFIGIPSLAIAIRRLHDIGKDWPSLFIVLIPVVGQIWLLILMLTPGETYDNDFGPASKDSFSRMNPYRQSNTEQNINIDVIDEAKIESALKNQRSDKKKGSTPKKEKRRKKGWLDRGAVDFTYHSKEKRKT